MTNKFYEPGNMARDGDLRDSLFLSEGGLKSRLTVLYGKFDLGECQGDKAIELKEYLNRRYEEEKEKEKEQIDPSPTSTTTTPATPQERKLFGNANLPIPNWVGRDELLIELHTELENNRRVLVLCGQGGIGKTSLAVKLMAACGVDTSKSLLPAYCSYDNVLFHQIGDTDSFESLVVSFFDAFGLAPNSDGTPTKKIESIVQRLHQQHWLVILDNLESLMEFDRAKSSDVGNLLNSLAYGRHNSQIVITSREFPEDLYGRESKTIDRDIIRKKVVEGISDPASIQLLRDLGMQDSQEDLAWIAGCVKGNVKILKLLADYADFPGQLRNEPDLVTETATSVVRAQWEKQGAAAQELLARMCVLRIGMDAAALTTLRLLQPDGEVMEWTKEAQKATVGLLAGLENSGLVESTYDKSACKKLYVLHRLIAETLQAIFEEDLKRLWIYAARLYGSFEPPEEFRCLEDWRFILEEWHFCWLLGMYEGVSKKVVELFLPSVRQWGYWSLQKEWLDRILPHTKGSNYRFCLRQLSCICRDTGKWKNAEHYLNLALTHAKQENSTNGVPIVLGLLGDIACKRGDYDQAEDLYNQALVVYTGLDDRAGMATSWCVLGYIARHRREYYKAEDLYNQALVVRTKLGDKAGIATSWGLLGDIARHLGNYDKAKALYNLALLVRSELGDRAGMAMSWCVLGDIARKWGDYDKAEDLYNQALAVRSELGDQAGIAAIWGVLGAIASKRGDYDLDEALYNLALAVRKKLGDKAGMAAIWGVLGAIASKRGDYDLDEALYNQSLVVRKKLGDQAGMASSLCVQGDIASKREDYDKAEALYDQSLAVYTKLGNKAGMAAIWGLLGDIARKRGDYDKAEALYNQALAVRTKLGDQAGMAAIWGVLGAVASKRRDYDKAEALYNQALAVHTKLADQAGMAAIWGVQGDIARHRGDYNKAEALYYQALAVRTKLGDQAGMAAIRDVLSNWLFYDLEEDLQHLFGEVHTNRQSEDLSITLPLPPNIV
jgi:tetratricopeptide (TPR) repeat protein